MKDKVIFWLDQDFTYYGIANYLQKKNDYDFFAIIDVTNKVKTFFKEQKLVEFKKTWYYFENISRKEEIDLEYLQNFEKKYNINLWELAINERIFYNYNHFHNFSDEEILSILTQECKLFESILDEAKPDFFLTKQLSQHKDSLFYKICKARGIKVIILSQPKFAYHATLSSESQKFDTTDRLSDFQIEGKSFGELRDVLKSYDGYKQVNNAGRNFAASNTKKIKAAIDFLLLSKNTNLKTHYTYFGRSKFRVLKHELTISLKKRMREKFIDKHFLKNINGKEKFIYFPLGVDEERTLLIDSPFLTNQIEMIRNIVKSMPIDYKLYVKEAPSQRIRKWRKISEYKEMLKIPNVRMIHPSVHPKEIYEKCSLVITIIGSAALEAAFYEKPSMVFTDINYAILPSVMKIDSIDMLADSINKSLQTKVLPEDLERYISLVEKNSFIADIFALRTNQHNHFHYGGHLIDVEISAEKMEEFLEQNKETLDILAEKNLERMKFLKINKSS